MSRRRTWMLSPHAGGSRIPPSLREVIRHRILAHAEAHYGGRYHRIDVRFRGALCYIDAYCEPEREVPIHLCRIRYFAGRGQWSLAFYTYSHERYEPAMFPTGDMFGTPEEAFDVGAVYLQ